MLNLIATFSLIIVKILCMYMFIYTHMKSSKSMFVVYVYVVSGLTTLHWMTNEWIHLFSYFSIVMQKYHDKVNV